MVSTGRWQLLVPLGIIIALAFVAHTARLLPLLPWPLLGSLLITWLLPRPGYALAAIALLAELFSGLVVGTYVVIVFLPWIVHRWRGKIEVDFAAGFFGLLLLTAFLQTSALLAAHYGSTGIATAHWVPWREWIPWLDTILVMGTVTCAAFAISVILHFSLPARPSS